LAFHSQQQQQQLRPAAQVVSSLETVFRNSVVPKTVLRFLLQNGVPKNGVTKRLLGYGCKLLHRVRSKIISQRLTRLI